MQLIDTHSHLDLHAFSHDFADVLTRSRENGVIAQILPGVCRDYWPHLLEVCSSQPDLFAAPGLHPLYIGRHLPAHLEELDQIASHPQTVAMGEIGLDYYPQHVDRKGQQQLFEEQIAIAANRKLPLLLHVRKAHDQVQATLRRKRFDHGGMVHAFSGSLQQAEKYLDLGFKIGFGGTITYDRATRIRSVATALPLEAIVLETDAPDLPPADHHGERNSPEYLPLVAKVLAQLRGIPVEEIASRTTDTTVNLLRLDQKLPSLQKRL